MPSIAIYVRTADYAKWLAIENKPQWLHSVLNDSWRGQPIRDMPDALLPVEPSANMTILEKDIAPEAEWTEKFVKRHSSALKRLAKK